MYIYVYIYIYIYIYTYIYIHTHTISFTLPEDRINVKLIVVNFSSCYFPYINDIKALFLILSTLVKIHNYLNI